MTVKYSEFAKALPASGAKVGTETVVVLKADEKPYNMPMSEFQGKDGREVALRKGATALEWQLTGDVSWQQLVLLTAITGADGKKVLLRKGSTQIQYQYEGDGAVWLDLIAIADLKGDPGASLNNRGDWVAGTYKPGDYVFAPGSATDKSMWVLNGAVDYVSSVQPKDDATHWTEFTAPAGEDGIDGTDGKQVELRINALNFEWRYVGDSSWKILGPTNQYPKWADKGTAAAVGTTTLNFADGECQRVQIGAAQTIAFAGWPVAGNMASMLMELVNGKAFAVTWPAAIKWIKPDGTVTNDFATLGQPLQTAGTDWVMVWSRDAGATMWGKVIR